MSWIAHARAELLRLASPDGAWAYRAGGEPSVEPTALALLGLIATEDDPSAAASKPAVKAAAEWLAVVQQSDGALPVSASVAGFGWPTAHALLAWQAVGGYETQRDKAKAWLLARKGTSVPRGELTAHDSTIVGWPWVSDTHSWIEPTVFAILALRGAGEGANPRVQEGMRMIRDRAIETGGWNYGNTASFGTVLRPQPAPTGMSLCSLATEAETMGQDPGERTRVDLAAKYLTDLLPKVRAPQSLAWGLLGLAAWNKRPAEAGAWLEESSATAGKKSDPAMQWAYLLLAAGKPALKLLHVSG